MRHRATFSNALGYAVELELLPGNPLARVKLHLPKTVETVDRQVVANPRQVRTMLARDGPAVRQVPHPGPRHVCVLDCASVASCQQSAQLSRQMCEQRRGLRLRRAVAGAYAPAKFRPP